MRMPRRWLLGLLLAVGLFGSVTGEGRAEGEQQRLVDRARLVAEEFLQNPEYERMRVYVQNAYGVLLAPDLLKGGFIVGGQYGTGVLLVRDAQTGLWSEPAFFDIYGGSLGLQLGGQKMDAIFTLMNPGAVDKLLSARFRLGADASGALGPVGSGVGAGTTVRFGEDVYLFSRNKGLFGGLSIDGTVIVPKEDWNSIYYGQSLTPTQIVKQRVVANQAGTAELRNVLARF
jgi:lipid-binding SYLF domain-containing protein